MLGFSHTSSIMSSSTSASAGCCFSSNPSVLHHHHHFNNPHQQVKNSSIISGSSLIIQKTNDLVTSSAGIMVVQGGGLIDDSASGKTSFDELGGSGKRKSTTDTRSKIRTVQGLRDRRVRLSIGIARKFFDLQDLLGFDKPSETVEWLLTKSNKAILDHLSALASSTTSVISSSEEIIATRSGGTRGCCKSLASATTDSAIGQVSCDDSPKTTIKHQKAARRENAKARARSRTLAKLCTGKIDQPKIINKLQMSKYHGVMNAGDMVVVSNNSEESLLKDEKISNGSVKDHKLDELQLHSSNGLSPSNLSLDWDIGSVVPQQSGSAAAPRLNLSRDIEFYNAGLTWDQLLNNVTTEQLSNHLY